MHFQVKQNMWSGFSYGMDFKPLKLDWTTVKWVWLSKYNMVVLVRHGVVDGYWLLDQEEEE